MKADLVGECIAGSECRLFSAYLFMKAFMKPVLKEAG